ncbi:MAG: hypothetical protein K6G03_11700 [Lachnospiraceae bacterium]|nr:hypothetical protein [Lachnospiraceae bacterium]
MPEPQEYGHRQHNPGEYEPLYYTENANAEQFQNDTFDITEHQSHMRPKLSHQKYSVIKDQDVKLYTNDNKIDMEKVDSSFRNAMNQNNLGVKYDNIRNVHAGRSNMRMPLKSSSGTKYMLDGESILQMDFGGTGATELERGKLRYNYSDENNTYTKLPLKDLKLTTKAGRIFRKLFSWFPGVWSAEKKDAYVRAHNRVAASNRELEKKAYGKKVVMRKVNSNTNSGSQTFDYIRRKDYINTETGARKTRYNFAGPTSLPNIGTYSMENVEEYALSLGSEWLSGKLDRLAREIGEGPVPEGTKKIRVMIQGHSRGGVAASKAAMRLNKWIHDHYEEKIANLVQFDITLYDPVPGKASRTGIREKADFNTTQYYDKNGNPTTDMNLAKYRSLGGQQNSTVIYCLKTGNNHFFTPQQIKGAKRLIFTVRDHNSITSHDTIIPGNGRVSRHRSPYIDLEKNTAYRGSGVSEMDEGLFIADNRNVLHRVRSLEEFRNMVAGITEGEASHRNYKRKLVLDQVAVTWFNTHRG